MSFDHDTTEVPLSDGRKLLCVDRDFWIPADPEERVEDFELKNDYEASIAYRLLPGGGRSVLGIMVHVPRGEEKENPLDAFSKAQCSEARFVDLGNWNDAVIESLNRFDLKRLVIKLGDPAKGVPFPTLPPETRYLQYEGNHSHGLSDFTPLSALPHLQWLKFISFSSIRLDLDCLAGAKDLEHLSVFCGEIMNTGALSTVSGLQTLTLEGPDTLSLAGLAALPGLTALSLPLIAASELQFVSRQQHLGRLDLRTDSENLDALSGLRQLRWFHAVDGGIRDLSVLATWPRIETVHVDRNPVAVLPKASLPTLKYLSVLNSQLSPETVTAFKKLNPQCLVRYDWAEALRDDVADADRLTVRAGYPEEEDAKVFFETRDRSEIDAFLAAISINEADSGDHCRCMGQPTVEFGRGAETQVALGMHHGRSLRWCDGPWWGDAMLTHRSAGSLARWLAERGVMGPQTELDKHRERMAAWERRGAAILQILPPDLGDMYLVANSEEEVREVFANDGFAEVDRAEWCLKLLGCDNNMWNHPEPETSTIATSVLPAFDRKANTQALARSVVQQQDRDAAYGAARLFYQFGSFELFEQEVFLEALPIFTALALQHPRAVNRRMVLKGLSQIEGGEEAIREVLHGRIEVIALDEHDEEDPGNLVVYEGMESGEPDEACSDSTYAAWLLARMGDKESTATIRSMTAAATGADKDALVGVVGIIEGEPVQ